MTKTDEALAKALANLAERLGTTVDHLYKAMMHQAFIDAIKYSVSLVLLVILSITLLLKLNSKKKKFDAVKRERGGRSFEENIIFTVVTFAIVLSTFISLFIVGSSLIDCYFNPEYYALTEILKQINNK